MLILTNFTRLYLAFITGKILEVLLPILFTDIILYNYFLIG